MADSEFKPPPVEPNEPIISVLRFTQAANRLEIMRNHHDAPTKLLSRLLRKYRAINLRHGNHNFRMFDLGPAENKVTEP